MLFPILLICASLFYMFHASMNIFIFLNVSSLNRLQVKCHFWSFKLSFTEESEVCYCVFVTVISGGDVLYMCSTGSSTNSSFVYLRGSRFFTCASICWTAAVCNM